MNKTFHWKRLASIAACLAVVAAIAISFLHNIPVSDLPGQGTSSVESQTNEGNAPSQAPSGVSHMFGGFLLTAYAAETEGQTLSVNYLSETAPVILQPDVEVGLASYSPFMNSVPGLPFTFGMANGADHALAIRVSVDGGELLKWDIESGVITQCGRSVECMNGETLYWSPIDESRESFSPEAVITVEAVDGNTVLGEQEIIITSHNYIYSARAGELERT
jgi:hypothetical protein